MVECMAAKKEPSCIKRARQHGDVSEDGGGAGHRTDVEQNTYIRLQYLKALKNQR